MNVNIKDLITVDFTCVSQYERECDEHRNKPKYEDDKIVVYEDYLGFAVFDKRGLKKYHTE